MAARIIELAQVRLRQLPQQPTVSPCETPVIGRFHFWCGASGERYVHTIYSLIDCPAIPAANYVLVRRAADGTCTALAVGRVAEEAASLNLARIRQLGATLGANEVHIHLLAGTSRQAKLVEFDLRAAHLDAVAAEMAPQLRH